MCPLLVSNCIEKTWKIMRAKSQNYPKRSDFAQIRVYFGPQLRNQKCISHRVFSKMWPLLPSNWMVKTIKSIKPNLRNIWKSLILPKFGYISVHNSGAGFFFDMRFSPKWGHQYPLTIPRKPRKTNDRILRKIEKFHFFDKFSRFFPNFGKTGIFLDMRFSLNCGHY